MAQVTRFAARTTLTDRMADFMAHLRNNGLARGITDTSTALAALTAINATDAQEARAALKAVCTSTADDFARFDDLFTAFWQNRGREKRGEAKAAASDRQRSAQAMDQSGTTGTGRADRPDADSAGDAEQSGEGRLTGSRAANLMRIDLREMVTPADIAAAEATAETLARAIRDRRSRRQRADRRGDALDLRRVIRASLATGGEPLRLYRRRAPERPVKLVAILDVSGSMTVYARVFLALLKGLMAADTDAYLFHTRLVRITDALRDPDALRAVNRLSLLAQGFGGGTRIGGNLAAFNQHYARRLVNGRSAVMILSDGFDTDPPEILAHELARLKKRGCRIIWLNPLKGWRDYQPIAAGMAAALPYLDLFAAANTLDALARLAPEFARL
jgi:uncharacterized protein with von Willebrand factor type A (vWA) domain